MQAAKFSLEGSVGVAQVEQLHASVSEAVQSEQSVELDLSEVRDIDGSILQLILATEAATSAGGLEFTLSGVSDSLKQLLTFNGAESALESALAVSTVEDNEGQTDTNSEPEIVGEEAIAAPTSDGGESGDDASDLEGESKETATEGLQA